MSCLIMLIHFYQWLLFFFLLYIDDLRELEKFTSIISFFFALLRRDVFFLIRGFCLSLPEMDEPRD